MEGSGWKLGREDRGLRLIEWGFMLTDFSLKAPMKTGPTFCTNEPVKLATFRGVGAQPNLGWELDFSVSTSLEMPFSSLGLPALQPPKNSKLCKQKLDGVSNGPAFFSRVLQLQP